MAAAVILIPEMLSGPRRAPTPTAAAAKPGEANLKRYTIDLQPAPSAAESPVTPTVIEEPAPPPEDVPAAGPEPADTTVAPPAGEPAQQPQAETAVAAATPDVQPEQSIPQPAVTTPVPAAETPQAAATPAPEPSSGRRWAVQLIAYDKREQAQRMAEDLRSNNIAAFVMPVQGKNGTLYRVRVGPFTARAEAEDALRKLKAVSSGAAIVAQP